VPAKKNPCLSKILVDWLWGKELQGFWISKDFVFHSPRQRLGGADARARPVGGESIDGFGICDFMNGRLPAFQD